MTGIFDHLDPDDLRPPDVTEHEIADRLRQLVREHVIQGWDPILLLGDAAGPVQGWKVTPAVGSSQQFDRAGILDFLGLADELREAA